MRLRSLIPLCQRKLDSIPVRFALSAIRFIFCFLIATVAVALRANEPEANRWVSAHAQVKGLEAQIEVSPLTLEMKATVVNHAAESRFLAVPLDYHVYRMALTDENGVALKLTAKGKRLMEPMAGSVRILELKEGGRHTESLLLGELFEFPPTGRIRCEVSRVVHLTTPTKVPSKWEWIPFPLITIPLTNPTPDKAK